MTLGDFTGQADAYKRSRPGYPEQLLDTLIDEASVQAGSSVVDFGAGTGILTEMLVNRQFEVTAVSNSPHPKAKLVFHDYLEQSNDRG